MNDLRYWIALVEGAKRVFSATGEPFTIFENPTRDQLEMCRRMAPYPDVKGLLTDDDDRLFIWSAWYAHHGDVAYKIGITDYTRLEMGEDRPSLSGGYGSAAKVMASPSIQRLYGDVGFVGNLKTFQPAMSGLYDEPPTKPWDIKYANKIRKRLGIPKLPNSRK
jgi:hypothetical protein